MAEMKARAVRTKGRIRVAPVEERTADGIIFASKREMLRYRDLKGLERAGIIQNLELQVPYVIIINGKLCCTYRADFRYSDLTGVITVEDSKGMRTEVYKLKRKLVEASYGIRIVET